MVSIDPVVAIVLIVGIVIAFIVNRLQGGKRD